MKSQAGRQEGTLSQSSSTFAAVRGRKFVPSAQGRARCQAQAAFNQRLHRPYPSKGVPLVRGVPEPKFRPGVTRYFGTGLLNAKKVAALCGLCSCGVFIFCGFSNGTWKPSTHDRLCSSARGSGLLRPACPSERYAQAHPLHAMRPHHPLTRTASADPVSHCQATTCNSTKRFEALWPTNPLRKRWWSTTSMIPRCIRHTVA